ncbi:uncharacterized protein LOC120795072 [Xiphias gladius]|uniref:uncharacterized protein LOC120795072 n=1 Tax=Xiphias gladius TaxID=8245 RepID=UPI001A980204|nr:uncharacterized protein LOC120795072 [Xiphias gladius]XP_039992494.1 uncharacterized protein LOC120795072 [Xiphias gladius]XP_039992495.1 uncharacterized protein LOC120795072 [Xiphias gladius]
MDQIYRRPVPHRELRVLNQKEDRDLRHKLNMLDRQYRYARKMLQQRRDWLINEQRRLGMVKVCEPKATVDIAMKEIGEHKGSETRVRGIHTSDGGRLYSRKSQYHNRGSEPVEQSRLTSAPPSSVKPTSPTRHRGNVQSNVSLMQMKNIATIDSISDRELARTQQRAREEMERVRQLQREAIHKRVTAFIESLKDSGNMKILVETP